MIFQELFCRFLLLLATLFILVLFSNRKKRDAINPIFCIVPFCTFLLCVLFSKTEIGLGIGFGLFAIFSILRFRTQSFSINTIIFLFSSITISILDCLFPIEKWQLLLCFQLLLIVIYSICLHLNTDKIQNFNHSFETIIALEKKFDTNDLRDIISKSINKTDFDFTIISVNFVSKQIVVKVFY